MEQQGYTRIKLTHPIEAFIVNKLVIYIQLN